SRTVRSVFFLQAEDGIRDWSVTGVQTCALPISCPGRWRRKEQGFARIQARPASAKPCSFRRQRPGHAAGILDSRHPPWRAANSRSEERRVGKEWRSRGGQDREEEKE